LVPRFAGLVIAAITREQFANDPGEDP
jgi:hypothetical protein